MHPHQKMHERIVKEYKETGKADTNQKMDECNDPMLFLFCAPKDYKNESNYVIMPCGKCYRSCNGHDNVTECSHCGLMLHDKCSYWAASDTCKCNRFMDCD